MAESTPTTDTPQTANQGPAADEAGENAPGRTYPQPSLAPHPV